MVLRPRVVCLKSTVGRRAHIFSRGGKAALMAKEMEGDNRKPRSRYRELVGSAAHRAALSFGEARDAARVTVTVLAEVLSDDDARHRAR
jgi:hypothetical protein